MAMAREFCKQYVENIFQKYDTDYSNVLERRQLKNWANEEVRKRPLQKRQALAEFNNFVKEIDTNGDNKIDKWELYDYCVKNYNE